MSLKDNMLLSKLSILGRAALFITLIFIHPTNAAGQTGAKILLEGRVLEGESDRPIEYANIGIINSHIGTISDHDGSFLIEIPEILADKELIFSSLGHESKTFDISSLLNMRELVVYLPEKVIDLQEVLVTASRKNKMLWLGNRKRNLLVQGQMYADSISAGGAIALLIDKKDISNLDFIKSVSLFIARNTFPEFKVRLRFLEVDTSGSKLPGNDLVQESIIKRSIIERGWMTFDLASKNLTIERDSFYIVFEWILDSEDRHAFKKSYVDYIDRHPERIGIDTFEIDSKKVLRINLPGSAPIVSTIFGDTRTKADLKTYKCYFRTNSFGAWHVAPGIVSAKVLMGNLPSKELITKSPRQETAIELAVPTMLSGGGIPREFNSDQDFPASIEEKLATSLKHSSDKLPTESLYIQSSKDIYETQEDLWFKCHVLNAQFLEPSTLSEILYVQLIHESTNAIVWQEKYEIQEGYAEGHIFLNDTLANGNYLLAAFTEHSISYHSNDIFSIRKIQVVDYIKNIGKEIQVPDEDSINFQFFPEGGNLISGLRNKIAFKASTRKGMPTNVSGTLFENGAALLQFTSRHAGMGSFDFVPNADRSYHVRLDSHKDMIHVLPKINQAGIIMHLEKYDDEDMVFHISQSPGSTPRRIFMTVQIRGVGYRTATAMLDTSLKIKVPLDDIPQGIAEVTLFDEHYAPVAERLAYVNHDRKLNIQTTLLEGESYAAREKVTLNIKISDRHGLPVRTQVGVSICESIFKRPGTSTNIMTHYYLSTQIRGNIYDPSYYFNPKNKDRLLALDLLLLTQGWRRYVWSQTRLDTLAANQESPILDGIQGFIRNKRRQSTDTSVQPTLIAYAPGKTSQNNIIEVDSIGNFMLASNHLKLGESGYMYLKYFSTNDIKYDIYLNDKAFQIIDSLRQLYTIFYPIPTMTDKIGDYSFGLRSEIDLIHLEEIVVTAKRKRSLNRDKYLGKLDSIAQVDLTRDYVCKDNILNCPGHPNDPENTKPREGGIYLQLQVWENGFVVATSPPRPGQRFRNPALPPYKYPKLTDDFLFQKFNIVRTKGFYGHREFYQSNHEEYFDPAPDFRNTLLWAPEIITDENGEATISFYCSDLTTQFYGEIEGVSREGLLGHKSFEFGVEN